MTAGAVVAMERKDKTCQNVEHPAPDFLVWLNVRGFAFCIIIAQICNRIPANPVWW